jgi:hypothetical protein
MTNDYKPATSDDKNKPNQSQSNPISAQKQRSQPKNKPNSNPNLGRLGKIGKQIIEVVQWEAELDDRNRG